MDGLFSHEKVSEHITRIVLPADVCVYLVEGERAAVLLDTGFGIGDLRGYVEGLTSLPTSVVLTHGHVDHAGGAGQWQAGEQGGESGGENPGAPGGVSLNERDWELVSWHCTLERRLSDVREGPGGMPEGVSEADFVRNPAGGWRNVDEGDIFDLGGGVQVEFIAVPGHTHGSLVPLVEADRAAIFGDACGEHTLCHFAESLPMRAYRESLRHLLAFEDRFDLVLRNHGAFSSPKSLLRRNLELSERVLAGTDDRVPIDFHGTPGYLAAAEGSGERGNIVYAVDEPR